MPINPSTTRRRAPRRDLTPVPTYAFCANPTCDSKFAPKRASNTALGYTAFCSSKCWATAKLRKYPPGQQRVNRRRDTAVPCAACGEGFFPLANDRDRGMALYCSKRCFYRRDGTLEDRLMKYREIDPATDCWLYTHSLTTKDGYGVLTDDDGKRVLAHRVAASLWLNIPLDDPRLVLHSCPKPDGSPGGDTRRCFNPSHLGAGNQKLNAKHAVERGRWRGNPNRDVQGRFTSYPGPRSLAESGGLLL